MQIIKRYKRKGDQALKSRFRIEGGISFKSYNNHFYSVLFLFFSSNFERLAFSIAPKTIKNVFH